MYLRARVFTQVPIQRIPHNVDYIYFTCQIFILQHKFIRCQIKIKNKMKIQLRWPDYVCITTYPHRQSRASEW